MKAELAALRKDVQLLKAAQATLNVELAQLTAGVAGVEADLRLLNGFRQSCARIQIRNVAELC
jgi:hypothetical protein